VEPLRYIKPVTLICFFLTGVTGLVYELVWVRMLILTFGSTQFAVTTVLTTFMAGLAIGSLLFGRMIDRYEHPLRVYGILEMVLGGYCIVTPLIFSAIQSIYLSLFSGGGVQYAAFNPIQFLLAFGGIILPSILMGGTLPVLTKYFTLKREEIGFKVGILYAINTLGSVVGCLATGLFLLYLLGVTSTIYLAGVVDIVIGAVIITLSRRSMPSRRQAASTLQPEEVVPEINGGGEVAALITPATSRIVIAVFAVSGFAALAYEVLWTRIFSLIIGSSIYAFTIMLATFLFGIGVGSIVFAPFIDKRKKPLLWFAVLELIIGIAALLAVPLYKKLPFIFLSLHSTFSQHFWLFLIAQFLLCAAVMVVPTLCMGAIFPTVSRIYTRGLDSIGQKIGNIYFFNTAGAIAGAFVGGFIMIPTIGVQPAILLTAAISTALGLLLLLISPVKRVKRFVSAGIIAIFFTTFLYNTPSWSMMVMTMGAYVNPIEKRALEALQGTGAYGELLFYREGINAIITVRREADGRTISYQSNGKYEARSVDSKPGKAWSLLGHLPMLFSDNAERALLVGIGSGITLGSMEQYPLKEIDVVEIEPAVVEAARFFSAANNNALDDPRVTIHTTDGRNFLLTGKKRYDVIVSAVSDPWITGVSNLFTEEYFREVRNRLSEKGVVALWFQNYRISTDDLKIGLNTFASVFPHVSLWVHYAGTSDMIVIGTNHPHSLNMDELTGMMSQERLRRDFARIEMTNPYDILNLFLMGNSDIRRYTQGAPLNRDDKPILEFALPKLLYTNPLSGANERVVDILANARDFIPPVHIPDNREEFYFRLGTTYASYVFRTEQAIKLFERVLELNPGNRQAAQYIKLLRSEL
jgi:spermidine synthase